MPPISIINQKGGVGKSTASANLAYGLAVNARKTESINQASIVNQTIFRFDGKSRGAKDFEQLASEVIGQWES